MKINQFFLWILLPLLAAGMFLFGKRNTDTDSRFITYIADPQKQVIQFYWKDENGERFGSPGKLQAKLAVRKERLVFAMNAGMYKADHSPVGLYIEKGIIKTPLDTASGKGNFYLKPNGIFYIKKDNTAGICNTAGFTDDNTIKYATQSGPMLVTNGNIHPAFTKGSANTTIRNGVGILPGKKVIFVLSKEPVSLYDFADFFKKLGCKNALYLDGFVSGMYLPEKKWMQVDGDFGVMIGITTSDRR